MYKNYTSMYKRAITTPRRPLLLIIDKERSNVLITFYKVLVIWPSPPIRQGQSYYISQFIKGRHTTNQNLRVPLCLC